MVANQKKFSIADIEQLLLTSSFQEQEENNPAALETARIALVSALENGGMDLIQKSRLQIARLQSAAGNFTESQQIFEVITAEGISGTDQIHAFITQGINFAALNDLEQAETYFRQALELSRSLQYQKGTYLTLLHLAAFVYFVRGWFNLAITLVDDAGFSKAEVADIYWGKLFLQGMVYQLTGERSKVRANLDEMVPLFQPGARVAAAYYYLWACLSLDEEELEKAEEYLRLALRISNQKGLSDLGIRIRIAYSRLFLMRGQAAVARTWADEAVQITKNYSQRYFHGLAFLQRAQASWESDDFESAEKDFKTAQGELEIAQAGYDLARASLLHATWQHQLKQPGENASWSEAADRILMGGYTFILEQERKVAFPLIAFYSRSRNETIRLKAEKLLSHLTQVDPVRLTVYGLGQFSVYQGRIRIPDQLWHRRKAGELFRYLLLQSNYAAGREEILDTLWPDSPPDAAMDLFHQATSTLRRILEPDLPDKFPSRYLIVEGERVYLRLPNGSVIDFERFQQYLPQVFNINEVSRLEKTLAMYAGDLFPMDRYEDWSSAKREQITALYQRGMLYLGKYYLDQEKYFQAVETADIVINFDPWSEDATFIKMQAYLSMGDAPHALKTYIDLEATLQKDLNIQPRSDLRSLADKIRSR